MQLNLKQTEQAAADQIEIGKCIYAMGNKNIGYANYTVDVWLDKLPEGWDNDRAGSALIDHVDGGWSPYGGTYWLFGKDQHGYHFKVKVFTD